MAMKNAPAAIHSVVWGRTCIAWTAPAASSERAATLRAPVVQVRWGEGRAGTAAITRYPKTNGDTDDGKSVPDGDAPSVRGGSRYYGENTSGLAATIPPASADAVAGMCWLAES